MIGLMLVGLIPIAVLGILLGHLLTPDSLAPAVGGTIMLFALLGGAYGFLVAKSGPMFDVDQGAALVLARAGGEDRGGRRQPGRPRAGS